MVDKEYEYHRARDNNREKRQFLQMAACAQLFAGRTIPPRDIVNRAHEIWDEIMSQTPEPKEPGDNDK